ncbi:MAG TPA: nuclear transport factor 2 family protein [Rhodocyclaceae bacterium]|nr:nuclear transport factor 2 family protein [Rhodocyclaceae bacterium]
MVAYDAILALQFKGAQAYAKHWAACLAMCAGPMIFEIHDLHVRTSDELALAHGLARCGGTGPDGKEMAGWTRMTIAFQKRNGKCLVVHEHFSAPFDVQADKVLWLEP